jgi:hypothetical protein
VTHTQGTTTFAAIERALDVVLEETGHAIVGEPFAQLDDSHQPGSHGKVLCHMSQSAFLIVSGLIAVRSDGGSLLIHIVEGTVDDGFGGQIAAKDILGRMSSIDLLELLVQSGDGCPSVKIFKMDDHPYTHCATSTSWSPDMLKRVCVPRGDPLRGRMRRSVRTFPHFF